MKKNRIISVICITVVLVFTLYVMLDTFVLSATYDSNAVAEETAFSTAQNKLQKKDETTGTETEKSGETVTYKSVGEVVKRFEEYRDENISITVTGYEYCDTLIYVADITVESAEYLKTAFADNTYGKNVTEKTSVIAGENNAVLAINGDYYGARESGYVIRNGKVYRSYSYSNTEICCIYADGSMQIKNSGDVTTEQLVEEGVWQAFSFGPSLLINGEISVSEEDEVGKAMVSNPRTAIGITDDNRYVFVVSDGRTDESKGLSLYELAQFMQRLGVTAAYNLDGGGSSTLYYLGEVINNPTTNGSIKERSVSDIVYIGY